MRQETMDILYQVALEIDLEVQPSMKVGNLRELIKVFSLLKDGYFVNSLVRNIIEMNEVKLRQKAVEEEHKQDALEEECRAKEYGKWKLILSCGSSSYRFQVQLEG
ncbi:hypothetical protein CDAR_265871 [Caerostris darwini]|uniref:Uncharacterized protein n=1 Tax=Caerostris darwini TaxID=1538125 RepID=A0AAV4V7Y8_9ARAC|nr:hypothetical protein CDAR_265871 [Caerostris darwini]